MPTTLSTRLVDAGRRAKLGQDNDRLPLVDWSTETPMNTANLQLEGLVMAIAAINQQLVAKGVLTANEVDRALALAEATAVGDYRASEDLPPASRGAIAFPVRVLRLANKMAGDTDVPSFSELAKIVGETKQRYTDQR
jgi:hypothetical protein